MKNWGKYEVKDGNRDYWTIIFRPLNLNEADSVDDEYVQISWDFYVLFGCFDFEKSTVDDFFNAREYMYRGFLTKEEHHDDILTRRWEVITPSASEFLRNYHNSLTYALMCSCNSGNIIETKYP